VIGSVVPDLLSAVIVMVGVSPALTSVNPDFVRTPEEKFSLPLFGLVGEVPEGAFVAVHVHTTLP
jgi:hypothetical protein